jgi:Family of unknown function (DUF6401)
MRDEADETTGWAKPTGQAEASEPDGLRLADVKDLTSYLAGQVGQSALDRLGGQAHPDFDQHLAAVVAAAGEVLGRRYDEPEQMLSFLVRYASGFVTAATSGGWQPEVTADDGYLDWESMRLAAVCELVIRYCEP